MINIKVPNGSCHKSRFLKINAILEKYTVNSLKKPKTILYVNL